jgi:hypothetical protein
MSNVAKTRNRFIRGSCAVLELAVADKQVSFRKLRYL